MFPVLYIDIHDCGTHSENDEPFQYVAQFSLGILFSNIRHQDIVNTSIIMGSKEHGSLETRVFTVTPMSSVLS